MHRALGRLLRAHNAKRAKYWLNESAMEALGQRPELADYGTRLEAAQAIAAGASVQVSLASGNAWSDRTECGPILSVDRKALAPYIDLEP
jgi:hypothetical protein